jgi:serine/threonine protein kinase
MAPEQLQGGDVDARADIFAFGAVVYETVTRERAFDGGSQASVIAASSRKSRR